MARSTIHYTDSKTNNILKALHNKLRPAGTPVQRVEYIVELLLLRIFEVKIKRDKEFSQLRKLFESGSGNETKLFYYLQTISSEQILPELNQVFFPFYANILHEARKVFKGNLNVKVQDQLTLIQEVFANSNFTNNVQSGNLEDVINLIADIDEERLLNTDMLGDAIESALSETGGTREIGLFRTPDHIRQMMVGLLEPNINDTIFDPACGTGGFLFDSFEFVMESISPEGKLPGPKAHPELQTWFKEYFKENHTPMPSIDESFQFYRSGIFGIEYLGMIRKMAAVNFYIRGLNPHNIEQGDSLAKFNNDFKNSKSIVLANPPFGAERDQKAYPNVWEEYSKESETTILFVKLMLDALKDGGKCAIVVSEGFLTWDQGSARALRKILLEEANLQAVIGLPQGVFISKNGQGPKTSVLLFEKGKPTKNVWFYNVENDGYSKGINRTQIDGCQLVEVLDIYHKYVKHGKNPPVTKNSFSISVEWLKVLDPRQKEKIRIETRKALLEKKKIAEEKLITRLNEKLEKAKTASPKSKLAKFDKKAYEFELWKFETTWEQKIQNEIAKRIDKAHLYSFNPSSYRSNLSEDQLKEWKKIFVTRQSVKNGKSLDKRYENLIKSKPEDAIKYIAEFDPENAIEADIVREYLSKIPDNELNKFPDLKKLDEIFKMGSKYPRVKLGEYLYLNKNKIKPANYPEINFKVLGVSNETGIFINNDLEPHNTNQSYYIVENNQFCYNPYRVNVGSIGLNEFDYENQIISGAYIVFGVDENIINPKFLLYLFEDQRFIDYVISKASGGVRMNFTFDHLKEWNIPLPPLEKQNEIVEQIERHKAVIEGAEKIINNWQVFLPKDEKWKQKKLGDVIELQRGYDLPKSKFVKGNIPVYGSNGIIGYHNKFTTKGPGIITGRSGTIGKVHFSEIDFWAHNTSLFVKYFKGNHPKFIYYLLQTVDLKSLAEKTTAVPSLDRKNAYKVDIFIPDFETQKKVAEKLDKEREYLKGIIKLKNRSKEILSKIIDDIWEN